MTHPIGRNSNPSENKPDLYQVHTYAVRTEDFFLMTGLPKTKKIMSEPLMDYSRVPLNRFLEAGNLSSRNDTNKRGRLKSFSGYQWGINPSRPDKQQRRGWRPSRAPLAIHRKPRTEWAEFYWRRMATIGGRSWLEYRRSSIACLPILEMSHGG